MVSIKAEEDKMSVSKNRKIVMVAVITAIVVFVVSALAASANLSGYERLKAAGFKLIEESNKEAEGVYSNGMFWFNATIFVDGAGVAFAEQINFRDGERDFSQNSTKFIQSDVGGLNLFDDAEDSDTITYSDKDIYYRWLEDGSFIEYKPYWSKYDNSPSYNGGSDYENNRLTPSERLFIEAIADALIGDTRNYFISDGNEVSISLSGNQIPQIAQYAVAAFTERTSNSYIYGFENILELGADARITYGSLVVKLDDEDNVIGANISAEIVSTVNGKARSYRFDVEYNSKNIGTTVLAKPEGNSYGRPILSSYDEVDDAGVDSSGGAGGSTGGGAGGGAAGVTYAPGAAVA